jgi:hypothetical protein
MRDERKLPISKATEQAEDDKAPEVEGHAARAGRMVEPSDDGDEISSGSDAEVEGHAVRVKFMVEQPTNDDAANEEAEVEGHAARGKI